MEPPFHSGPLAWVHSQGFPKSLDIGKAIDRAAGEEREVLGPGVQRTIGGRGATSTNHGRGGIAYSEVQITAPATPAAKLWQGYGTALKPAWEPVVVAMKPLDGTFAENALTHGVAGLNVDGGRVQPTEDYGRSAANSGGTINARDGFDGKAFKIAERSGDYAHAAGRWPPNLALVHHPDCREVGTRRVAASAPQGREMNWSDDASGYSGGFRAQGKLHDGYADADGLETVAAWECVEGCPVKALDEQAGKSVSRPSPSHPTNTDCPTGNFLSGTKTQYGSTHNDSGPASRFYPQFQYCEKADGDDRDRGLRGHFPCVGCGSFTSYKHLDPQGRRNKRTGKIITVRCSRNRHVAVKPFDLCRWLATLLLPPPHADGSPRRLLVPFSGSGSEIAGAIAAGWEEVVGIEMDAEHAGVAVHRIRAVAPLFVEVEVITEAPTAPPPPWRTASSHPRR